MLKESDGGHLNKLHEIADHGLSSKAEKKEFSKHLGEAMAELNADILMPIVCEYPDLDLDRKANEPP